MNLGGWILLILTWSVVLTLFFYSFYKILKK